MPVKLFSTKNLRVCLVGWILGNEKGREKSRENYFLECLVGVILGEKIDGAQMFSLQTNQNVFSEKT